MKNTGKSRVFWAVNQIRIINPAGVTYSPPVSEAEESGDDDNSQCVFGAPSKKNTNKCAKNNTNQCVPTSNAKNTTDKTDKIDPECVFLKHS